MVVLRLAEYRNNEKNMELEAIDKNEFIELLLEVNPVYNWLEDNIECINYKLLKGFITNIVPLGKAGEKYFKVIAHSRTGFTKELWKIYNQTKKLYQEGKLKINSYIELEHFGYTGVFLDEIYPVNDILKYLINNNIISEFKECLNIYYILVIMLCGGVNFMKEMCSKISRKKLYESLYEPYEVTEREKVCDDNNSIFYDELAKLLVMIHFSNEGENFNAKEQ